MFSFLKKDPTAKLKKQYSDRLEEAMNAQRNGDMRLYAELTEEAEKLFAELQQAEKR